MHLEGGLVPVAESLRLRTRLRIAARSNAREVSIAPSRFVRRVWEISANSDLGRMFEIEMPAALTRMSTLAYKVVRNEGSFWQRKLRLTISFSSSRIHEPASPTSPTSRRTLSEGAFASLSPPFEVMVASLLELLLMDDRRLSAAASRRCFDLPTRTTLEAPSRKNLSAMARPIPEVPPVIRQFRPERRVDWVVVALSLVRG